MRAAQSSRGFAVARIAGESEITVRKSRCVALVSSLSFATGLAASDLRLANITDEAGAGGPSERGKTGGHGVMFADVDGDGLPDLYVTMIFEEAMPELFYRNLGGGRFREEGARRGIDDYDGGSHGACFADLNNDGHYDLFNGATWHRPEHPALNQVYRNDGRGFFTEVTEGSGIPRDRTWPTRAVLAFDMDGDGDLDLFCATNYLGSDDPPDERNEVYRNRSGFQFVSDDANALVTARCGQGAIDTDYDGDGYVDVIAANRTGDVKLLRNDGEGNFTLVPPASLGIRHRAADGITTADVRNSGRLDLLLTSANEGHLYSNNGDGTFTFAQSFADTAGYMGGFADLNQDGFLDLVFAGDTKVYLNDGHGGFAAGPAVPVGAVNDPRGIAFADLEGDGDLDFAVGCKRSKNCLIRNDVSGGGGWLKVRLVSPEGQAGAFGAKTSIYRVGTAGRTDERLLGMRESRSNQGYLGQDDPVLHFGLADHPTVDVVVRFPDGSRLTQRSVAAGQTILMDGRGRNREANANVPPHRQEVRKQPMELPPGAP